MLQQQNVKLILKKISNELPEKSSDEASVFCYMLNMLADIGFTGLI